MTAHILIIDIGGSGIKVLKNNVIQKFDQPDYENFEQWLYSQGLLDQISVVGISCAGIVANNIVIRSTITGWLNRDIAKNINKINLYPVKVYVVNDAEAHLMTCHNTQNQSVMCMVLGTSIAIALRQKNGEIYKNLQGENIEVGTLILRTSCQNPEAWYALSSNEYHNLCQKLGTDTANQKFGFRVGGFLNSIHHLFRPDLITLTGGLVELMQPTLLQHVKTEFQHTTPLISLQNPEHTALFGLYHHIINDNQWNKFMF